MRYSKNFQKLLKEYKQATESSGKRKTICKRMKNAAKTFADYSMVYQLTVGWDNRAATEAEEKMKELVLHGQTTSEIRLNILDLFQIMEDKDDRERLLEEYLEEHDVLDDYLFVATQSDNGHAIQAIEGTYQTDIEFDLAIENMESQIFKLQEQSDFMKESQEWN